MTSRDAASEKPRTMIRFDAALGKALMFNRDDLQANRVGGITDRQRTAIYGRMLASVARGIGIVVVGLVVLGLALITQPGDAAAQGASTASKAASATPLPLIAGGMLFLAALVLGGLTLQYAAQLRQDLKAGKVEHVHGETTAVRSLTGYQVQVGGMTFRINAAAAQRLQSGDPVMLYYAPHSKWILAVEAT